MIAVDTNLLVYAYRADSKFHAGARDLIDSLRHQSASWAIPWPCVHEFIGIVTHPKVFNPPAPLIEAVTALESWQAGGNLHMLAESPGYFEKLQMLAVAAHITGPRIHDARIAALCLHHGVSELWTADRDCSRFPQLKIRNPLIKK